MRGILPEFFVRDAGGPSKGCQATPNRVSRSQKFLWTSRALIEVALLGFRKPFGVGFKLSFDFIAQSG